jgi:hypothetical protein
MSDKIVAWLRTVLPGAYSALVAYFVTLGLPTWVTDLLGDASEQVVGVVILAVVYPVLRWLEVRTPDWLSRLLMGSARPPTYDKREVPA